MKRWVKVILAVAAAVVAVAIGAVAVLQIPRVQKAICDKVTDIVSEKTGLDVEIGDIHIALFDRIIADNVSLKDGDKPILNCEKVSMSVSPLSILKGDYKINRISLDGGEFYPSNLPQKQKKPEEDGKEDKPFELPDVKASIGHLKVNDFKVVNYKSDAPHVDRKVNPRKIDFHDMNVTDLHVDMKDIKYDGKSASMDVQNISFKEQVSCIDL